MIQSLTTARDAFAMYMRMQDAVAVTCVSRSMPLDLDADRIIRNVMRMQNAYAFCSICIFSKCKMHMHFCNMRIQKAMQFKKFGRTAVCCWAHIDGHEASY